MIAARQLSEQTSSTLHAFLFAEQKGSETWQLNQACMYVLDALLKLIRHPLTLLFVTSSTKAQKSWIHDYLVLLLVIWTAGARGWQRKAWLIHGVLRGGFLSINSPNHPDTNWDLAVFFHGALYSQKNHWGGACEISTEYAMRIFEAFTNLQCCKWRIWSQRRIMAPIHGSGCCR